MVSSPAGARSQQHDCDDLAAAQQLDGTDDNMAARISPFVALLSHTPFDKGSPTGHSRSGSSSSGGNGQVISNCEAAALVTLPQSQLPPAAGSDTTASIGTSKVADRPVAAPNTPALRPAGFTKRRRRESMPGDAKQCSRWQQQQQQAPSLNAAQQQHPPCQTLLVSAAAAILAGPAAAVVPAFGRGSYCHEAAMLRLLSGGSRGRGKRHRQTPVPRSRLGRTSRLSLDLSDGPGSPACVSLCSDDLAGPAADGSALMQADSALLAAACLGGSAAQLGGCSFAESEPPCDKQHQLTKRPGSASAAPLSAWPAELPRVPEKDRLMTHGLLCTEQLPDATDGKSIDSHLSSSPSAVAAVKPAAPAAAQNSAGLVDSGLQVDTCDLRAAAVLLLACQDIALQPAPTAAGPAGGGIAGQFSVGWEHCSNSGSGGRHPCMAAAAAGGTPDDAGCFNRRRKQRRID